MLLVQREFGLALVLFRIVICDPKTGHRCPEGSWKLADWGEEAIANNLLNPTVHKV